MRKIVLLLGLVLVLALVACSEEATPEPEPTPVAAEPTAEPVAEPTEAPAEEPAAEPAAESMVDAQLVGVEWYWKEFQDMSDANSLTVPNPEAYTVLFNEDGTANIKADCNNVLADVTTDGSSSLSFMMGPSTMVFCGEESLDQQYLANLGAVATYVISDGMLYMRPARRRQLGVRH